ncbi:membrane protein [Spirochaetia bacterium]|nr:membrane protein [Spirochaetia bacterium]
MAATDLKISFQSKEKLICPACESPFHREEPLTGSGRLIAGDLTDELHRLYEPSLKYGEIYPLAYQATVCPQCWFASMDKDFTSLPRPARNQVLDDQEKRIAETKLLFPNVDFHENRGLINGAASFYLVARCYDFFPKEVSPTFKQGIASLRAGWMLDEMNKKYPGQHYDWAAVLFKRKAQFFYAEAFKREQNGMESLSGIKNFGPDTDKNYAYEGALYLSGLLWLKYGPRDNMDERREALGDIKRTIAKMFGLGRTSKSKPGPLLENARALYDNISRDLNEPDDEAEAEPAGEQP